MQTRDPQRREFWREIDRINIAPTTGFLKQKLRCYMHVQNRFSTASTQSQPAAPLNVCASIIHPGQPSPTVNEPRVGWVMRPVLRSRSQNIYAFGRKTAECILPTSRSLRQRALSVQYM